MDMLMAWSQWIRAHPQDASSSIIDICWKTAAPSERECLSAVYSDLKSIPTTLQAHVQFAHYIAILEQHEHRKWNSHFKLHGVIPNFQKAIQVAVEISFVDAIQRANYLTLALGGQRRHLDVAYGLSEPLPWRDKDYVTTALQAMGRREYHQPIPTSPDLDNGVLHIALSYRHSNAFNCGGTICATQAETDWQIVNDMPFVTERTRVRVWIDQNLHRNSFPPGVEWHEYGLLPYACLPIIFVGDAEGSLAGAYTRPWLWVEFMAGLKANGIHRAPNVDLASQCHQLLERTSLLPDPQDTFAGRDFIVPPLRDVDAIMRELALNVSMWRRNAFLGHAGYPYAHYFERVVNWCRRFLMRDLPYSQMSWNHCSDDVQGTDAIVLLRSFPRDANELDEVASALVLPRVSWKRDARFHEYSSEWIVGDVIDRSGIDELPLSAVMESKVEEFETHSDILLYGTATYLNRLRLRKSGGEVQMVFEACDAEPDQTISRFTMLSAIFAGFYGTASPVVRMGVSGAGDLISYKPFTGRMMFANGHGVPLSGSAEMKVQKVGDEVRRVLKLRRVGVCVNLGICEEVYEAEAGNDGHDGKVYVSTTEVHLLLKSVRVVISRFNEITRVLKRNGSYKWMRYRDLSEVERRSMTHGWTVGGVTEMKNSCIMSGSIDMDVADELLEIVRQQNDTCTLLTSLSLYDQRSTVVVFRGPRHITRVRLEDVISQGGLTILREQDEKRVNELVRSFVHNTDDQRCELSQASELGWQTIGVRYLYKGLIASCRKCRKMVCNIDGSVVSLEGIGEASALCTLGPHDCFDPNYNAITND